MATLESDLVVLDSRVRTSGTTQNANYNLVNIGGVKGTYELMDFHSTNQVYNVETGVNDTIYWTEPGALTATIPAGSYTQTTLHAAMIVVMDIASASTFTFTVAADTGLVTVAIAAGTFAWAFNGTTNGAGELIGQSLTNPGAAASIVGDLVPNLVLHTHILVSIPQDGTKAATIMNGTEFTAVVPLDQNFGDPIRFRKEDNYTQTLSFGPNNFTIIDIQLFTEDGNTLDNAAEYVIILRKLFD